METKSLEVGHLNHR